MAYQDYEDSTYLSEPIYLLVFTDSIATYRYTTYGDNLNLIDGVYTALAQVKVSDLKESLTLDTRNNTLELTFIYDVIPAQIKKYTKTTAPSNVKLELIRYFDDDNKNTVFYGELATVTIRGDDNECVISFRHILMKDFLAVFPQSTVTNTCRYVLGDARCGKDLTAFRKNVNITAITSTTRFNVDNVTEADGYFKNGTCKFGNDIKHIRSQIGTEIILNSPFVTDILVGSILEITAGCNKSWQDCVDKFDNEINNGSFPTVPTKNIVLSGF